MKRLGVFWLAFLLVTPASAGERDDTYAGGFVLGRYHLIGRHPDSASAYSGTASIARVGDKLRLTRRVAGHSTSVLGIVKRADPGEAEVLAFAWGKGQQAKEMVCQIGSDLDNYPRLTCLWGNAGNPHKLPGMEAYFSQEPWKPLRF